jgi:hypothetical protein
MALNAMKAGLLGRQSPRILELRRLAEEADWTAQMIEALPETFRPRIRAAPAGAAPPWHVAEATLGA